MTAPMTVKQWALEMAALSNAVAGLQALPPTEDLVEARRRHERAAELRRRFGELRAAKPQGR